MENIECPLCCCSKQKYTIFKRDNVFASVAVLCTFEMSKLFKEDSSIQLLQCGECGFIFNQAFSFDNIEKVYSQNNLYYQQKNFTNRLSKHILSIRDFLMKYGNKEDIFLEIAPGYGDLLFLLSKEVKKYYSVDPSASSLKYCKAENVVHICEFFNDAIKAKIKDKIQFIIFRHVLEHVENPNVFLKSVVDIIEKNGYIYIEVPNAENIFRFSRFTDIYHDHCGYFQKGTIIKIMQYYGCELIDSVNFFEDKYIGLLFKKNNKQKNCKEYFTMYDENTKKILNNNIEYINKLLSKYECIGLYGGASQSNALLNYLDIDNSKKIKKAFEIDRDKVGKYLINSKIPIEFPSKKTLKDLDCIVMCMNIHETFVFQNEIIRFVENNKFRGDVIKMANSIELVKFI
ncbi:methyltransferase domain-containing protein [Campylobacter jejuni]|nr:methyltransferase domain-containing protein [Campylobacter jejuni]